jgi:putative transposase
LKFFAIEDEFARESLAIEVDAIYCARHGVATLNRLCSLQSKPAFVRGDNGLELISRGIKNRAAQSGVQIAHTQPGKPWQNGTIETFNSRF